MDTTTAPADPITPTEPPADKPKTKTTAKAAKAGKVTSAAKGPGRPSRRDQRARQLSESLGMVKGGALMAALAAKPDALDPVTGGARRGTLARDVELFPADELAQALANLADRNATVAATLDRLLTGAGTTELVMVALMFAYAVADNHGLMGTGLAPVTDAPAAA